MEVTNYTIEPSIDLFTKKCRAAFRKDLNKFLPKTAVHFYVNKVDAYFGISFIELAIFHGSFTAWKLFDVFFCFLAF